MSKNVGSVATVGITVSDLKHMANFFQQVLGFTLQGSTEVSGPLVEDTTALAGARGHVAMLTKDNATVELIQFDAPAERQTYQPRPVDVGSWRLGLYVTDLDDVIRRSAEWGWTVYGKPTLVEEGENKGTRIVYLSNEDGTIIEFFQNPSR